MRRHLIGRSAGTIVRFAGTIVAAVAAVVWALATQAPSASADHTPAANDKPWGFHELWGITPGLSYSNSKAEAELAAADAIIPPGRGVARLNVDWTGVEKNPPDPLTGLHTYDWSKTQDVYQRMLNHGLSPVITLVNAPEWARTGTPCPAGRTCSAYPPAPAFYEDWKKFVAAAIDQFPNAATFEIWNEANLGTFWGGYPNHDEYNELLKRAHHAQIEDGSNVPIMLGGLAPVASDTSTPPFKISADTFLNRIYRDYCKCNFDAIGTHPYPGSSTSGTWVSRMWTKIDSLLSVRNSYSDQGKPVWITETGISTDVVPLSQQGGILANMHDSLNGHASIAAFIIFRFHDHDDSQGIPGDGVFDEMGVTEVTDPPSQPPYVTPKPAYCTLGSRLGTRC